MLQHPTTVLAETSMKSKSSAGLHNSGIETRLQQVLSHLHGQSLGEPTCQVCNEPISDAEQITLYLYKSAGNSTYRIGQCRCRSHDDGLTDLFTLGVDELVVDGRVGQCRDHATHQTWPVLIAPTLRRRSTADTTTGRVPPDQSTTDQSGPALLNYPPIAESGR